MRQGTRAKASGSFLEGKCLWLAYWVRGILWTTLR